MSSRLRKARRERTARKTMLLRVFVVLLAGLLLTVVTGVGVGVAFVTTSLKGLPDPDKPGAFRVAQPTKI
jgi:hypothetical protein